jgi:hypothetical protein
VRCRQGNDTRETDQILADPEKGELHIILTDLCRETDAYGLVAHHNDEYIGE